MLQAVLLFLVAMLLLGMVGKWRRPGAPRLPRKRSGPSVQAAEKCRTCGTYVLGAEPCRRADCPRR